jgi:hypothetical protein
MNSRGQMSYLGFVISKRSSLEFFQLRSKSKSQYYLSVHYPNGSTTKYKSSRYVNKDARTGMRFETQMLEEMHQMREDVNQTRS